MNMRPPEPLTPEERELAARIARLGPHGEPSPALDAKILAAAHSAVAGMPRRRRPRWPLYTGVAASALLAVGIAWQLRPTHEVAMPAMSDAPAASEARIAQIEAVPAQPASPPPPLKAVPPPANVVPPVPERAAVAPTPKPSPATPLAEPAPMADAAAGAEIAAPAELAFAPEPPVAMQRAAGKREAEAYEAQADAERQRRVAPILPSREYAPPASAPAPAPPPPAAGEDSTSLDQVVVTGTRAGALAGIPVEKDAKLSKRKWLKRIQRRLEQDDVDGARASLRLFVGKYPRAELPPELRELLEE